MSEKYPFLSDEWVSGVEAIVADYANEVASSAHGNVAVNLVVTDTPFGGDRQFHMGSVDGKAVMGGGHLDPADLVLTTDYATAKDVFIAGNPQAGMQAFMSGKIKVQGDMTKLMAQQAGGGGASPEMQAAIQAITE